MSGRRPIGRLSAVTVAVAMVAATLAVVLPQLVATHRVAAANSACTTGTIYDLGSGGNIYQLATADGSRTLLGTLPANPTYNALGITADGSRAFAAVASGNSDTAQIFEFNTSTHKTTADTGPAVSGSYDFAMGAVDPTSGVYYLGSVTATGVDIYGYDTVNNVAISGRIAQVAMSGASGGDMVFDATGHLYIVSGNQLVRVNQSVPTTGTNAQLTTTLLTDISASSLNGVTFDGDGYLYASSSSTLTKLNPNTGAVVSTVAITGSTDTVDLADCQYNGQLQLQADIVGRYAGGGAGDQFGLSITGGGISSGNTATTSGSGTGLQSATTAGPVVALAGTTYEIRESAASGSLADYTVSASCVDTGNGNAPITLSPASAGSTTDYTLAFPSATDNASALSCVFTDTPLVAPTITLTKALAATRVADTDQFTVQIRTGSATGPVVSSAATATTSGSGATVTPGTGTTGVFTAAAGTVYYLTEAAAGTTNLASYQARISCSDAANLQSGLPVDVPFAGSLAITPVNGARISCVLSNGVQRYSVASAASPARQRRDRRSPTRSPSRIPGRSHMRARPRHSPTI